MTKFLITFYNPSSRNFTTLNFDTLQECVGWWQSVASRFDFVSILTVTV